MGVFISQIFAVFLGGVERENVSEVGKEAEGENRGRVGGMGKHNTVFILCIL